MPTLPTPETDPQGQAVAIVMRGITVLRDRDGVPLTDEQIEERARNIIQALIVTDLVPHDPLVKALTDATARFDASNERLDLLAMELSR